MPCQATVAAYSNPWSLLLLLLNRMSCMEGFLHSLSVWQCLFCCLFSFYHLTCDDDGQRARLDLQELGAEQELQQRKRPPGRRRKSMPDWRAMVATCALFGMPESARGAQLGSSEPVPRMIVAGPECGADVVADEAKPKEDEGHGASGSAAIAPLDKPVAETCLELPPQQERPLTAQQQEGLTTSQQSAAAHKMPPLVGVLPEGHYILPTRCILGAAVSPGTGKQLQKEEQASMDDAAGMPLEPQEDCCLIWVWVQPVRAGLPLEGASIYAPYTPEGLQQAIANREGLQKSADASLSPQSQGCTLTSTLSDVSLRHAGKHVADEAIARIGPSQASKHAKHADWGTLAGYITSGPVRGATPQGQALGVCRASLFSGCSMPCWAHVVVQSPASSRALVARAMPCTHLECIGF